MVDKKGGLLVQRKSVISCIEGLQSQLDLVDIWTIKHPETKSFTWSQKSPRIFCRLDYWLICNNLNDLVQSTDIIPAIRTDHDAICIGNHMISSAIWDKSARVNFSKANQIARARRASAICSL